MTDNYGVNANITLPCGHQHKAGTRFCTICGLPVPADIRARDGSAYDERTFGPTQTVQAHPGAAMPGGGPAEGQGGPGSGSPGGPAGGSGGRPPGGMSGSAMSADDTSAATALRPRAAGEQGGDSTAGGQPGPSRSWEPGRDWQPGPEPAPRQDWQQPAQPWPPGQPAASPERQWQQPQYAQQPQYGQQPQYSQQPQWDQQPQWPQAGAQWQRPGPPDGSFPPGAPQTSRGRSRWPLIAGVIVAVAVLGGGTGTYLLLAHHGQSPGGSSAASYGTLPATQPAGGAPGRTTTAPPGTTPPATTTPAVTEQQAATSLAGLLQQSVSDRSAINQAYNDVLSCGPLLSQDQQTFQQAAASRQSLISQLSQLPGGSTLPAPMLADLTSAWRASYTVDEDYAQWAADESSNGCVSQDTTNSSYSAAVSPNEQATSSKSAFASQWNPIASRYGLTQYTQNEL